MKSSDSITDIKRDRPLLCLKGADSVKFWQRFATVDRGDMPCTYISEDHCMDAISFIPTKDITFVGFSVYPVISSQEDFTVHYTFMIGD